MSKDIKLGQVAREYLVGESNILVRDEKGYPEYMETPYKEYKEDGRVIYGTEDFTDERDTKQMHLYAVCTPTGKLDKGGHRRWKELGYLYCTCKKDARMIARLKYGDIELQIRRW